MGGGMSKTENMIQHEEEVVTECKAKSSHKPVYDIEKLGIRVIFLGNSGVGKTCVLERYQSDRFFSTFGSTAGVETYIRKEKMDGKDVTITFYDSGGQEKFRAIVRSYYRKS
ncbi:Small GTPase like protein, partial [Aduncisulcus paluster]